MSARKNPTIFIIIVALVVVGAIVFLKPKETMDKPMNTESDTVQKSAESVQTADSAHPSHAQKTATPINNITKDLQVQSELPVAITDLKTSNNQLNVDESMDQPLMPTPEETQKLLQPTSPNIGQDTLPIASDFTELSEPFEALNADLSEPVSVATDVSDVPQIQTPDARDIVKLSDDLMRGDSNQGIYIMEIKTPNWSRTLELDVASQGRDKVFIRILSPSKEAGTGTLRIENEMWNYLPRIEKVIKIPPSMMLQPWMGSDFANDDLVKENSIVDDYSHKILTEEIIRGHNTYKIEMIPHTDAAVIWGKLYYWIRKDDHVPIQQEYYSEKNELVKRLEYSDIGQVSDRIIPRVWLMTNLQKDGKSTRIHLKDVSFNQPIDENLFTLSNLKRYK